MISRKKAKNIKRFFHSFTGKCATRNSKTRISTISRVNVTYIYVCMYIYTSLNHRSTFESRRSGWKSSCWPFYNCCELLRYLNAHYRFKMCQQLSTNEAVDPLAISAYSCRPAEQSLLVKSVSRFLNKRNEIRIWRRSIERSSDFSTECQKKIDILSFEMSLSIFIDMIRV